MIAAPLVPHALGDELLDDPAADPLEVRRTLGEIAQANRFFGGSLALRHGLARALAGAPTDRPLTLLDLGTGDGALPREAAAWARPRGWQLNGIGLERSGTAARIACRAGTPTILGDAGALPVADASVDLVLMNLFVHHFAPASIVQLLREADRIARHAVIISDLERSGIARACFAIGSRLLGFGPVTRHDGDTSIRRGFTAAELAALAAEAGVPATVTRRPFWRLVAVWHPVRTARAPHPSAERRAA